MNLITVILFTFYILSEGKINNDDLQDLYTFEDIKVISPEKELFDSFFYLTNLEEYPNVCDDYTSELCAKEWLTEIDIIWKRNSNRMSNVHFKYETNINKRNEKLKFNFHHQAMKVNKKLKEKLYKFQWKKFQSSKIKRIFQKLTVTTQNKNVSESRLLMKISHKIQHLYNHARPCYIQCLEKGEIGIVEIFTKEKDYDKLTGYWSSWRNETGRKIKNLFVERVYLENKGAKENGYTDAASVELKVKFEEEKFNETILKLYEDILPLYKELHGYVRYCLAKFYKDKFDKDGPIPAHILGNVWGQHWNNILPILQECAGKKSSNSIQNEANNALKYIPVKRMVEIANEFYQSIGMYKMTSNFWERSVFVKQPWVTMDCHASAHNFVNGKDFRIKMCTEQNVNDFTAIHHEMGHIEYFMAYRNLPNVFQSSANPGFHEAIGDTIALSVKTPEHLQKIGLIETIPTSQDFDIDYLLTTALEKVAFLPFALTMDSYIWSVYNGSVPTNKLNEHWWNLRYKYQGLKPPIKRTEEDFDPGAKYHLAFGISYIRYFVSYFHQFQFYEAMCNISNHSGPLHRCDFYGSKDAGKRLLMMLKMGKSQHWRESLQILTNSRNIESRPLLTFFEPLYKWLRETNKKLGVTVGW